ncbi:DUF1295-domain-containing protein, partial [Coniochaeta ligniaria NRRL 30616]
IHILDQYYLTVTLLTTIAYQLVFFSIAFSFKFDKLTDLAGGTNFILLSILTLSLSSSSSPPSTRQLVVSIFLSIWALRLSSFLFYRILKTGRDTRFDDKRDHFFSFLGFWIFQMIWVWTCSLPVTVLNSPAVRVYDQVVFGTGRDVAGCVTFGVGLVVESIADVQRFQFRQRKERWEVCDGGLWKWSRHPNYFGEILVQFGIYTIVVSAAADCCVQGQAYKALYATILGPLFLTVLLIFVSGIPLSEWPGAYKWYENGTNWDAYARYLDRTSILIPLPPQLYVKLPTLVKRTLFLEFPMYVFD